MRPAGIYSVRERPLCNRIDSDYEFFVWREKKKEWEKRSRPGKRDIAKTSSNTNYRS